MTPENFSSDTLELKVFCLYQTGFVLYWAVFRILYYLYFNKEAI